MPHIVGAFDGHDAADAFQRADHTVEMFDIGDVHGDVNLRAAVVENFGARFGDVGFDVGNRIGQRGQHTLAVFGRDDQFDRVLIGLAIGLAAAALPWFSTKYAPMSAALIAASIATIAPWTVNNAVVYHTFLPLSTSNGQLWQGSPEYYELRQSGRSYLSIWENELNGAVNGGHYPASIEGDRWFTRRAIDSIEHDPLTYARYSAEKVAWFWIGHPSADWFDGTIFGFGNLHRYWPTWEVVWMLASRLLPLVALAALIIERRRLRRLWPLVAVLAYFTVVHALTWAELRLSDPMVPLLAVVIGVAFTSLRPGGDVATDAAFHPRAGSGSRSRSPVLEGSSETEVAYPASSGSVSTGVSAPVRRSA